MAGQYVTAREDRFTWTFLALYVQCTELYALAVDIIEVSTNFFRGNLSSDVIPVRLFYRGNFHPGLTLSSARL